MAGKIANRWYWVCLQDGKWFPAWWTGEKWTNLDTWEDFDGEVKMWAVLLEPDYDIPGREPQYEQ